MLLLGPLTTSAGLPLVVCTVRPGVLVTSVLWAVSGACTAYQVQLVTESMQFLRWRYRVVRLTPSTSATSVKGVPAVTMREVGPDQTGPRWGQNTLPNHTMRPA